MDESGDLGFDFNKRHTSQFFVITFLFVPHNKRRIEKIIKKIHQGLNKKYKRKSGVLHAVKEKPITRKRLLRFIAKENCQIMTIYLNKKKVFTRLQEEKQILYNYVTNILLDRIYSKKMISSNLPIHLIASKRETNKFLNLNFKSYLIKQVNYRHKSPISIQIATPFQEKALQAVDFISWSIFRKYERKDATYYNIIKSKIIEENSLFG